MEITGSEKRPSIVIFIILLVLLSGGYFFWQKDITRLAQKRQADIERMSDQYYEEDNFNFGDGSEYTPPLPDDTNFNDLNLGL